jgi:hypothetical protein
MAVLVIMVMNAYTIFFTHSQPCDYLNITARQCRMTQMSLALKTMNRVPKKKSCDPTLRKYNKRAVSNNTTFSTNYILVYSTAGKHAKVTEMPNQGTSGGRYPMC